jgi:phosphoenolpyruvate carboxykinase (ATP)
VVVGEKKNGHGLELRVTRMIKRNLTRSQLVEEFVRNNEGRLSSDGALIVDTGAHTGRAAKDKFIVRNSASADIIDWGEVNRPMDESHFDALKRKVIGYLETHDCYEQQLSAGADPEYSLPLVVRTSLAYQSLFARTLFRPQLANPPSRPELAPFTIYSAPQVTADPQTDGTRSDVFIALNFRTREVLIGGTFYAGEMKKSVFTIMNTILPQLGVMTMHAAANVDSEGESAIFFGLSGTGKTTLSSDPNRFLVGDDEHGWSDRGIFNFEGGCYAKTIRLSPKAEPQIWDACHSYGTIIENVDFDPATRVIDFDSDARTENTRAAYSLDRIPNYVVSGVAKSPRSIVMLACDAFGVLPPVARLSPDQAMYYFLSGYTAKVSGTEAGITEPTTTFSACFGQPFMTLKPTVYAELLASQMKRSMSDCYLVNTGWWKGPYGAGSRMPIRVSRAIVAAAVDGSLSKIPTKTDPVFGFQVPEFVPGLDRADIDQRASWEDPSAYDLQAKKLAGLFVENFAKYSGQVANTARSLGPVV